MDSCLVLTERLSRQILHFRTPAFDVTHLERVSTSTLSFLAERLAHSSHASMMILKLWCHEYETGPWYFGPYRKDLSVFDYRRYWDHLSLYCQKERITIENHSRNNVWDSEKDHWSLLAADMLCYWKFRKQPNGYSCKKYMVTPCIERMDFIWDGFLIQKSVNAFIGKLYFQKRAWFEFKKRLLLRFIQNFETDFINNMDHMRIQKKFV